MPLAFDYLTWEVNAFLTKGMQTGVKPAQTLSPQAQHDLVIETLRLTYELEWLDAVIGAAYARTDGMDPAQELVEDLARQKELRGELERLRPMAESILEAQVSEVLVEEGIARLGNAIPRYCFTSLPCQGADHLSTRRDSTGFKPLPPG